MASTGFIGLGIMGRGMALNLLKQGRKLVVWNRTAAKCDELAAMGATVARSPAEVVAQCEVTYSMLSTPAVAADVFYDDKGTLAGVGPGKMIVDCATLDPATMIKFHAEINAKGGRFLEAPVSGSKGPAEQGTLVMMCAGDKDVFDKEESTGLAAVGKASFFLGEVGAASRMKLGVNMVMGQMMCALSEGIHLTDKAGLDPATFVEILGLGAMACPMYKGKGPAMVQGNYPTQFPLKHQHKDVRLACELGKEVGAKLPQAAAALNHFEAALPSHADDDFSAVLDAVRSPLPE
mmetsp:Transcript_19969/g.51832  ORF Transcript_19969/g.51832 Transcript_19969/m.51832 type:complete len:292 (-) Transcript_19969:58-933(-)